MNLPDSSGRTALTLAANTEGMEVLTSLVYRLQRWRRRAKKAGQRVSSKEEPQKSNVR